MAASGAPVGTSSSILQVQAESIQSEEGAARAKALEMTRDPDFYSKGECLMEAAWERVFSDSDDANSKFKQSALELTNLVYKNLYNDDPNPTNQKIVCFMKGTVEMLDSQLDFIARDKFPLVEALEEGCDEKLEIQWQGKYSVLEDAVTIFLNSVYRREILRIAQDPIEEITEKYPAIASRLHDIFPGIEALNIADDMLMMVNWNNPGISDDKIYNLRKVVYRNVFAEVVQTSLSNIDYRFLGSCSESSRFEN